MARRPCLDCPALTDRTRCPTHERAHDLARGTRHQRGYTTAWVHLVAKAIEAEPWCHHPGGCCYPDAGTPANPLSGEHLDPVRHAGTALPSLDDITVLCRRHNSAWRARTGQKN